MLTNIIAAVKPIPPFVAKTIAWSILLLLLAIAAYYGYLTYNEQQRRKYVQALISRFKNSQTARSVYLNITSHYINTPIAVMQGTMELFKHDRSVNEETAIAAETQLSKLAQKSKDLLANAHNVTSSQMATVKVMESMTLPSLLSRPAIWLPIIVIITIAALVNFIFIQADKYTASLINLGSQIGIAVVGIATLITSYYYYRRMGKNRSLTDSQLELEKQYVNQQVKFIQDAHSELAEDVTALDIVAKPLLSLPRGNNFRAGLQKLYTSLTKLARLSTLTKSMPGLKWNTSVNEVAKTVVAEKQKIADQAGVSIVETIDPNLKANIDETSLAHLIEATLDNAIKFSPAGSQVSLALRSVRDGIMVRVEDQGKGIAKELQYHLLTPFARDNVKQFEYEGMGLDLYMCRVILEQCNGKFTIISEPGKGTIIAMVIPRSQSYNKEEI